MSDSDNNGSPTKSGAMAYDPNQNPEDKRRIRKRYRGLLLDDTGSTRKAIDYTTEQLVEKVREADEIFEGVVAPGEAALDSSVLVEMSNIGAAKARAMKAGGASFDIDDFLTRLSSFMTDPTDVSEDAEAGPLDWEKIGRRVMAKSRRAAAMDFMLGPLQVEQKKRTAKQRARLEKNKAEEQKPQEIREEDIQRSENETTKNVLLIKDRLEIAGQVNLFQFVINPNDFAQSVENIFHLSFLIRDGECALEIEDGEPMIYICEQPSKDDYDQGLKKQQLVLEFDIETWRTATEVFKITEPMIPQRPKVKQASGNKWYG